MNLFENFIKPLFERYKNSRFGQNAFWSLVGAVIMRGLGLLTTILLVRILGVEVFGQFIALQASLGLFGTFAGLGMGMTITKHVAELKVSQPERAGRIVALCLLFSIGATLIISLTLLLGSSFFSENVFNSKELLTPFRIMILLLIANTLNGLLDSIYQGMERYKLLSGLLSFYSVLYIVASFFGAYFYGLLGAVTALALCSFIIAVIKVLMLFKIRFPFLINGLSSELHVLRQYSLPTLATTLVSQPVNWLPSMVFASLPGGYVALGIFGAFNQIRSFILFLPDAIGRASIPLLAESYGNNNKRLFLKQLRRVMLINLWLASVIAILFVLCQPLILSLYALEYEQSTLLLLLIGCSGVLISVNNALGYGYLCTGRLWKDFRLRIVAFVFFLGLILFIRYGTMDYVLGIASLHIVYQLVYGVGLFFGIFKKDLMYEK
jgi:O-antigen/teichoic acid export membrane protein